MKLVFADQASEDYLYWQKQDKRMGGRINKLICKTQREPFAGLGKPEPLKHALYGFQEVIGVGRQSRNRTTARSG